MNPQEVKVSEMILVAMIGFVINGASIALLFKSSKHDLNIKSAILHELGDLVSSIAVIGGGIAIFYTGKYIIDPILAVMICVLIVVWAYRLIADSVNILLEATPAHLDIDEAVAVLKNEVPGVLDVNHVHAWTITSSMYSLTANVVVNDCTVSKSQEILKNINGLLKNRFNIEHTNIQFVCKLDKEEN